MLYVSALVLGIAIASVPMFSYSENLSVIPRILSVVAVVVSLPSINPARLHASTICYFLLALFFSFSLMADPLNWYTYGTMAKLAILVLACNFIVQTRQQLLIVFACYAVACPITFLLNYRDIVDVMHKATAQAHSSVGGGLYSARFAGTFANANTAGLYSIAVILLTVAMIAVMRWRLKYLLALCVVPPAVIIGVYSGSRKAMLGFLFVAVIAGLSYAIRARKTFGKRVWAWMVTGVLALAGLYLVYVFSPHAQRMVVLFTGSSHKEASAVSRVLMFQTAIELWLQSPLWGNGWRSFDRLSFFGTYSHSSVSDLLCNGGVLGLGLWVLMFWFLFRDLRNSMRFSPDPILRQFHFLLLAFLGLTALFSLFAVLFDDRSFIPLLACMAGYLKHNRESFGAYPAEEELAMIPQYADALS